MPLMKRANCERRVPEDKVPEYLALGYSVISENGEVLQKGTAQSKEDLLRVNADLTKENEDLKSENEALKVKIAELEAKQAPKFKCPYCDKEYSNEASLARHIKKEHPDAPENQGGTDGTPE